MFRSILFVPATRPDRFDKAMDAGADAICIDLEDAIPAGEKPLARKSIAAMPSATATTATCLRFNAVESGELQRDIDALSGTLSRPSYLAIPKVQTAKDLDVVVSQSSYTSNILAIIETARGLLNAEAIAAHPAVAAIIFGSADYSADVGSSMSWDALLFARCRLISVAAAFSKPAIDGAWLDINDEAGLRDDTAHSGSLGFSGRVAIHPRQIEAIHAELGPTEDAVQQAEKIVSAFEKSGARAIQVDGRMIDQPVYEAAKDLLTSRYD